MQGVPHAPRGAEYQYLLKVQLADGPNQLFSSTITKLIIDQKFSHAQMALFTNPEPNDH